MAKDFLKGDSPDIWTREDERVKLFTELEKALFQAELEENFFRVLKLTRMILRLQMEVMKEKNKEGIELTGINTPTFIKQKETITNLQTRLTMAARGRTADPTVRNNNRQEVAEIISEIENLLDELFNNNTVLGLNYKKKDDPMKAYYGNK